MLKLYTGNRLEDLADSLAGVVAAAPASPLSPEYIVVQSNGMDRWISMQLAARLGVWANGCFRFPEAFIRDVFRLNLENIPDTSLFSREIMTFSLMELIPGFIAHDEFKSLNAYLENDETGLKLMQLAGRIADIFDQYVIFRPDLITQWESGCHETGEGDEKWQSFLWRALVDRHGKNHRAAQWGAFFEKFSKNNEQPARLPSRISVFGISALPPFFLDLFAKLSEFCDVHLFVVNPCQEYWGDIFSEKEIYRKRRQAGDHFTEHENMYLETGNPLLAAMGKLGRDFLDMVQDYGAEETDLFAEPGRETLLGCVQNDIFCLRASGDADPEGFTVPAYDVSIQIHSCHSPMREIEVLFDRLLDLFERNPDLDPGDVVVMAPDIEKYVPFVRAVFEVDTYTGIIRDEIQSIPFTIADRSARSSSSVADSLFAVLDLAGGRFGAAEVLKALDYDSVRQRFGISESDLPVISRWLEQTRVCWGLDQEHRKRSGFTGFSENSWFAALDRMLLGFAMPGRDERMFSGILPFDDIEGADAQLLGSLCEFISTLAEYVGGLNAKRTITGWGEYLGLLLDRFLLPDEQSEPEILMVRLILDELAHHGELAGFASKTGLEVIRAFLDKRLKLERFGSRFLTGGVTFCKLLPMRSIPFKVICLLGMNDGDYPRADRTTGFNLMSRAGRRGDRSSRLDDLYMFLEAIVSAREVLYISYVGQDIRDNSEIPPSVLVCALLDYLDKGYSGNNGKISADLLIRHPLQPFSPRYFNGHGNLFSYSAINCAAASSLIGEQRDPVPLITSPLPEPSDEYQRLSIERLTAFFINPAEFLIKERLGVNFKEVPKLLNEREPFVPDGLDRYFISQKLLKGRLAERESEETLGMVRASGMLPVGATGDGLFKELDREAGEFVLRLSEFKAAEMVAPLEVDLELSGFNLTGRLDSIYPDHLLQYRFAKLKCKDRLTAWIRHLALNALSAKGYPDQTLLVAGDTVRRYIPAPDAIDILEELLELYWQGLKLPLHFFPDTSFAYAESFLDKADASRAMNAASKTWNGSNDYPGEFGRDKYYPVVFRDSAPLDDWFTELSLKVCTPLFKHEEKI
ncbi:MAG: exodeoxyribonuclease V subunit gamma [Thermodesulfobacteriota bacterium]|nr:exodeoxyribonuclease V subunit gamma [Thermodesulfobacteriota bacterium]